MKPTTLHHRRAELSAAYAKARRQHRAHASIGERLRETTTALLRAEIAERKPRRGRPRALRPANPDLFVREAQP